MNYLVYGPTFPNETHYEKLLTGRQRFGNRSANMFFVRPARHIACPRRLKYIHGRSHLFSYWISLFLILNIDIKTGYIPYVEDSSFFARPASKQMQRNMNDDMMHKNNGLKLCKLSKSVHVLLRLECSLKLEIEFIFNLKQTMSHLS